MKKVMFIQLKGNSYGGVWQVIKTVGEKLADNNYDVTVVSLRENHNIKPIIYDGKMHLHTINNRDIWENNYFGSEIKKEMLGMHLTKGIKMLNVRIKHDLSIKRDTKVLKKYIKEINPDYIVVAHYHLLDMIPNEYLKKTIHEQHSSFNNVLDDKANKRTLDKYIGKIKYLWLTKSTTTEAIEHGYSDSTYIYNPVRFESEKVANVTKNKKLVTIARLSPEKRIDKMITICENIFKDKKYKDWSLEIYGSGSEEDKLNKMITNTKQIKMMGLTDNPKEVLLLSSINLNTSDFEGFALSILEANECGVPTVTLNFGENVTEEIIHNKTGIIAKDINDYEIKLKELMDNAKELETLSKNAKEFSNNFKIDNIVKDWINLFKEIDNK